METKICFKCGKDKSLDDFYKHLQMADGHLGKCKQCTKDDVRAREAKLKNDPEWILLEKKRSRNKYHNLGYKGKYKSSPEDRKVAILRHKLKYPEKQIAKNRSENIDVPNGIHRHHWSYNEEHWNDIIPLTMKVHQRAHCYIIYDQERMMYRALDGILLDSRTKHENYINSLPF